MQDFSTEPIRVLSINGGGVRGIIPAMILKEITQRTGKTVQETFDLFVGTSTGSILCSSYLVPDSDGRPRFTADKVVRLMEEKIPEIFERSLYGEVTNPEGLLGPKYDAKKLDSILKKMFQSTSQSELLAPFVFTSVNTQNSAGKKASPIFFDNKGLWRYLDGKRETISCDLPIYRVARASGAAPTFFPPEKITIQNEVFSCIDGGCALNDPNLLGLAEAKRVFGSNQNVLCCALGTGQIDLSIPYKEEKSWGEIGWASDILNELFISRQETMQALGGELYQDFFPVQLTVSSDHSELDDGSKENIDYLKEAAKTWIEDHDDYLRAMCKKLIRPKKSRTEKRHQHC